MVAIMIDRTIQAVTRLPLLVSGAVTLRAATPVTGLTRRTEGPPPGVYPLITEIGS